VVGRSDGYFVLYPVYFDSRATRAQGRRVPTSSAAPSPDAKDLFAAAKAAGLEPVLEDEHPHPSRWYEKAGRVLVPESAAKSKNDAILEVAQRLRAVVQARGPAPGRPRDRTDRVRGGKKRKKHRRHR
jgi:signal recognition particle subunit SRP19